MTEFNIQLTVVIPTHRRQNSLVRLLKSLASQHFEHSKLEVIVVSNIPDQATELALSQLKLPYHLDFQTVGKLGVNRARNLGLKKAQTDLVFFLDDDCELIHKNHLSRIQAIHTQLPHVSAVGGLYSLPKEANVYEKAYTDMSNQWVKDSLDAELMQTERLLGGNVCYKKSHLDRNDLTFNNSIVFGGAETELHNRMVQKHMDLRLCNLDVLHHVQLDKKTFLSKAYKQGYGSSIDPIEKDKVQALSFISKKRTSYLEYLYRHLFRAGQKKAMQGGKISDSDLSPSQLLAHSIESRIGKTLSNVYISFAFIFWFGFHKVLSGAGLLKRGLGIVRKKVIFSAHAVYWPVRDLVIRSYLFCKWSTYSLYSTLRGLTRRFLVWIRWRLHDFKSLVSGAVRELYWLTVKVFSRLALVGQSLFWRLHSFVGKLIGSSYANLIKVYWLGIKLLSRIKMLGSWLYWQGISFRGQISRIYWILYAIVTKVYWWSYKWFHRTKGALVRLAVVSYWKLYNRWRDFVKTTRAGIDPKFSQFKFSVSDKPSAYLPVSQSCQASCSYCHLLKAKESKDPSSTESKNEASNLELLGYFRVTLPCNAASIPKAELESRLENFSGLEKELLLNPDLKPQTGWKQKLDELSSQGFEFLLLHRPGLEFEKLYRELRSRRDSFRILSLQSVSPDLSSLYKTLESADHSKVEWLSTSAVEPVQTDPKNKKKANQIAKTLKRLSDQKVERLPRTSNIHYPFLVPSDQLRSRWPDGFVAWESEASKRLADPGLAYSIIVPVRFQLSHSCKILRNFSNLVYDKQKFEIIFVDDGNNEPLAPRISKTFAEHCDTNLKVRVIRWDRVFDGKYDNSYRAGQARNLGVKFSQGRALLFIDSDIVMAPELLSELDQKLTDDMLVQFPRHMLTEAASRDYRPYSEIDRERDTYKQDFYWENFKTTKDWESLENYWKYTCTYGLGVTRKTFQSIGPFRSEYIYYGFEDVDFGYRLFQKGAKFLLIDSPVFHLYPDKENSFHFDQDKRFNALSKSASIFLHRNMDLGFYMDLNHFLDRSIKSKMLQPYYYFDYKWNEIRNAFVGKKGETQNVQ